VLLAGSEANGKKGKGRSRQERERKKDAGSKLMW
jgi:hypothetical protein